MLQRVEDVSEYLAERERLAESGDDGSWARLDMREATIFARTQELQAVVASREAATSGLAGMAQVVLRLATAETVEDVTGLLADAGLSAIGADGGAIALRDGADGIVHLTMTPSLGEGAQGRFGTIGLDSRLPGLGGSHRRDRGPGEPGPGGGLVGRDGRAGFRRSLIAPGSPSRCRPVAGPLGSLLAGWTEERTFTADEIELVQAFASQCALAVDRLRSLALERRSAERSRQLAEQLQRSMLSEPLQPEHCRIAFGTCRPRTPARWVGTGTTRSSRRTGRSTWSSGTSSVHDIAAAATMGQLRSLLRGIAVAGGPGPAQVLDTLERRSTSWTCRTYATVGIGGLEQTGRGAG